MRRRSIGPEQGLWRGWVISIALHALLVTAAIGIYKKLPHEVVEPPINTVVVDHSRGTTLTLVDDPPFRRVPVLLPPITAEPIRKKEKPWSPPATTLIAPVSAVAEPPPSVAARPTDLEPPPPPIAHAPTQDFRPAAPGPVQGTSAARGTAGGNGTAGNSGNAPSRLPVPPAARSVVYVLDRSLSMGLGNRLDIAFREIVASLRGLAPGSTFQVVVYNRSATVLTIAGSQKLVAVNENTIAEVAKQFAELEAEGGNDHLLGLREALFLQPDAICLLTDADDLTAYQVREATEQNSGRCSIHAVTIGSSPRQMMRTLAASNRGTCRELTVR